MLGTKKERRQADAIGQENIQEAIRLHEAGGNAPANRPETVQTHRTNNTQISKPQPPCSAASLTATPWLKSCTASRSGSSPIPSHPIPSPPFLTRLLTTNPHSHGWGIPPDPPLAIHYLSLAASSAASIESAALSSGLKKGGAAKGELVLAIYELANSYRHGWGVEKDKVAARNYYECAANMGDTDAMNEVARCYDEGDGGRKDRVGYFTFTFIVFLGAVAVMRKSRR